MIGSTLQIAFDSTKVQRGMANLKKDLTALGNVNVTKLGAGIAALGIAGAGAVAALGIKINSIGEAALASENRLKNIVSQMGLFGGESDNVASRLIDLGDTQSRLLGIDGDVIAMTQAKLLTFKELALSADTAGGAFARASAAALDMAAAGFGTAETNAVQLGKALNDPIKGINALTKSGITFTAEEKKKIAAMMKANQTLKAQDMVLKAIEQQVGGTAAATATASNKIKFSMDQVVDSFAAPFSQGFNGLPAAMESIFPQLLAAATKSGEIVSAAIADSIKGNNDRFVVIGELIGTALSEGMNIAFEAARLDIGKWAWEKVEATNPIMALTKKVSGRSMSNYIGNERKGYLGGVRDDAANSIRAAAQPVIQGNQGLVPGTNGRFQFAPPGSTSPLSDANGNKVIETYLGKIEKNTAQGAKM